jgi:hypothetical protein
MHASGFRESCYSIQPVLLNHVVFGLASSSNHGLLQVLLELTTPMKHH